MSKKRVVLTGGGSGGHIFPLVAIAEELQQRYQNNIDFLYIGTYTQMSGIAEQAMDEIGIKTKNVATGKMRRYFSAQYFFDFFRIPIGIIQSLYHLLVYMPDAVFSKGGYASLPVVVAAWMYRIPILTHDSDAVPGWANRIGGKLSRFVAVSYKSSIKYFLKSKTLVTGNPIRQNIINGNVQLGYARWGFSDIKPTILVIGGSQGAKKINEAIVRILPDLSRSVQILHITGPDNYDNTIRLAAEHGFKSGRRRYIAKAFLNRDEMADAYAIADVIVSRSGANSITEIAATKNVAIFVPLARSANNHQYMNAYEIAKIGGALVLEEQNLGGNLLQKKIEQLLHSRTLRQQMQKNISKFYKEDASEKIANGVIKMMQ